MLTFFIVFWKPWLLESDPYRLISQTTEIQMVFATKIYLQNACLWIVSLWRWGLQNDHLTSVLLISIMIPSSKNSSRKRDLTRQIDRSQREQTMKVNLRKKSIPWMMSWIQLMKHRNVMRQWMSKNKDKEEKLPLKKAKKFKSSNRSLKKLLWQLLVRYDS